MADISLRKFARLRGVRLSAVQKAIKDGRVTAVRRVGDRIVGIDYELARLQWDQNTDPAQAARSGQVLGATPAVQASGLTAPAAEQLKLEAKSDEAEPAASSDKPDKDPHGYYAARATREQFQAKQAELDYLEAIGLLVSVDDMRLVAERRYRAIRDKVLNVADRLSAILAAEKDPIQVHAILTKDLKRVLHELSDDAGAEAARGVAERVAA